MRLVHSVFVITNTLGVISIFKLISIFFERQDINKKIEFISYSLYFVLSSLVFIFLPIPLLMLFFHIISIFALTFNYEGTIKSRITATIYVYLIIFAVEIIFMSLFDHRKIFVFKAQELHSIYLIICVRAVVYIVSLILSGKKNNLIKYKNISIGYWTGVISIPIASLFVIIMFLNIANVTEHKQILFVVSVLIMINLVSFQLYNYTLTMLQEKNKKIILQKQNSSYLQQLRIIQADNAKMSLIRHDIKNHLFALKSLYEKGDIDSFKDYFNCILSNIDIEEKLCNSGNIIVDSMINYKLKGVANTDISVDVCIPEKLDISDMDITVILGNLLDNALRAIKKVNERGEESKLHLNLNYTKGRLILRIENSYLNVNLVRGNFLTTKKDKKGHGLGLESVKEVLSKYDGVLQITCDKGVFIVEAVLYCR